MLTCYRLIFFPLVLMPRILVDPRMISDVFLVQSMSWSKAYANTEWSRKQLRWYLFRSTACFGCGARTSLQNELLQFLGSCSCNARADISYRPMWHLLGLQSMCDQVMVVETAPCTKVASGSKKTSNADLFLQLGSCLISGILALGNSLELTQDSKGKLIKENIQLGSFWLDSTEG